MVSSGICAGEEITLPAIEVEGQKEGEFAIQPAWSAIGTKERVDRGTIEVQGGAEQISPYKAISLQPGVDITSKDAFGMEISHRIRGKSNRNVGELLEGLPLKGIGPGVGLSTMVDLENIEAISLTKGAVSADSGFGYGNESGVVDMHVRRPLDYAHATLTQGFGSEDFMRSYARLDTGILGALPAALSPPLIRMPTNGRARASHRMPARISPLACPARYKSSRRRCTGSTTKTISMLIAGCPTNRPEICPGTRILTTIPG
ncbi:hypothetical protein A6070_01080 [Syntrophotalea acetylenica]|nr:hypothetical protein A6070_01080 [Syntrophotalea acetylenica]